MREITGISLLTSRSMGDSRRVVLGWCRDHIAANPTLPVGIATTAPSSDAAAHL
jgi:hypothetical protein